MTEAEIRKALVTRLAASSAGVGAAFIAEMFLDRFARRADLVMANGKLSVFEIKSERDTLDRLQGQLESYLSFFELVTVVCAEKHLAGVRTLASAGVGIWSVRRDGTLTIVRRAKTKPLPSRANWLSFLPVDELRAFLRAREIRASGSRGDLVTAAEQAPLKAIRAFVLEYLKRRDERIEALVAKRTERRMQFNSVTISTEERLKAFLADSTSGSSVAIPRAVAYSSTPSSDSSS